MASRNSLQDGMLDPGDGAGGRLPHDLAQPAPAGGRRDVHHLPHARRTQPEQHLDGAWIVLRHQRDGGDRGELADQVPQHLHLVGPAPVHADQHGVHRTLSHRPDGVRNRVAVEHGEQPAARRVHPGALSRHEHRGDGSRAGIGDVDHAFLRQIGARG